MFISKQSICWVFWSSPIPKLKETLTFCLSYFTISTPYFILLIKNLMFISLWVLSMHFFDPYQIFVEKIPGISFFSSSWVSQTQYYSLMIWSCVITNWIYNTNNCLELSQYPTKEYLVSCVSTLFPLVNFISVVNWNVYH